MIFLQVLLFIILSSVFIQDVTGDTDVEAEKNIIKKILKDYNPKELPSAKTTVHVNGLDVDSFELNEERHTLWLQLWFDMSWRDPRLTWSPSEFNNIKKVPLRHYRAWQPQLSNADSPDRWDRRMWMYEQMEVYHNGSISLVPEFRIYLHCILDMTYWPHDTHNCTWRVRSWVHGAQSLDFIIKDPLKSTVSVKSASHDRSITINNWEVPSFTLTKGVNKYACCEDPFTDLTFTMLIRRNAPALNWTTKLPVVGMSILGILIFLMPPGSTLKYIYGSICLLLETTFLMGTSLVITYVGNHTPLMIQYIGQQLILGMLSLLVSGLVVRMSTSTHPSGLPLLIRGPVIGLSRIVLLGNYADQVTGSAKNFSWTLHDDNEELGEDSPKLAYLRERSEWQLLAAFIDRIFLLLYITIAIISFIRFNAVL